MMTLQAMCAMLHADGYVEEAEEITRLRTQTAEDAELIEAQRRKILELQDERNIFRRTLDKRDKQIERLKGCIPAYEPPPCECCRKFTDYYAAECDCMNPGDHEAAVRWCTRMEIADSFEDAIRKGKE